MSKGCCRPAVEQNLQRVVGWDRPLPIPCVTQIDIFFSPHAELKGNSLDKKNKAKKNNGGAQAVVDAEVIKFNHTAVRQGKWMSRLQK